MINDLINKWENRYSCLLAYAEEAFFAGDTYEADYFLALARQWESAIEELRNSF